MSALNMDFKNRIRKRLISYPKFHYLIRIFYRLIIGKPEPVVSNLIRKYIKDESCVFFVQVGSHDGITGDPIHNLVVENLHYRGIFCEPVPRNFDLLKRTYAYAKHADKRLRFENLAISQAKEIKKFYCLSQDIEKNKTLMDILPQTYDQLSSFNKDHVKSLGEGVIPYILEIDVPCLSLPDLLDKHQVKKLDLLHIDVEGFDYQVLSQLDFSKYHPKVILYEHAHLSESEKKQAKTLLDQHGYGVAVHGGDTLAIAR